jgi:hypothetical protein
MLVVVDSNQRHFRKPTPVMNDPMLPLPGLSSVSGRTLVAKSDSGLLSSDSRSWVLRAVEQRLRAADRLAACIEDPRAPNRIIHRSPTSSASADDRSGL